MSSDASAPISPPSETAGVAGGPLSPEQFAQIENARVRGRKIRRAATVAAVDAWCSAVFAVLTLLSAIFSPICLAFGLAFCVTAFNSFRGLRRLRRIDASAPRLLALNQILLAAIVITYALYSIWSIWPGHGGSASPADDEMKQLPEEYQHIIRDAEFGLYISLLAGTIAAQGAAAWYYITRKKYLITYLRETPQWVIDLQRNRPAREPARPALYIDPRRGYFWSMLMVLSPLVIMR